MSKVFCNIPWKEVHINADGTYHTCGAQPNTITGTDYENIYNVKNMTIPEWVNSQHQKNTRLNKLNDIEEPLCSMCYYEENLGSSSKRLKENHKSGVLQDDFNNTFKTSIDYPMFIMSRYSGATDNLRPESYHISLGNECNLACRMCSPTASSKIAVRMIQDGTYKGPARMNWTEDAFAWQHVVDYICTTDSLKFVHLIGGEPLMNPRFEDLIDRLLAEGKTDIYLGFTTNGTIFNESLIYKLNAFRHVDIGVSIECWGKLNDYVRQGSNAQCVLDNIDLYLKHRKEAHVYVTVRPVPSALTVHTLDELYKWCISRKLDVMTNILNWPEYQQIRHLPENIKDRLINQYRQWIHVEPFKGESNPRDPNRFREHIDTEIMAIIKALKQTGDPAQTKILYTKLKDWGWLDDSDIKSYFVID
jgi:MoaA/NifB/PqqE/SkfB family radical SAM enzyme